MPRDSAPTPSISLTAGKLLLPDPQALSSTERLNGLCLSSVACICNSATDLAAAICSSATINLIHDSLQRPLDALIAELHQLSGDATADRYQLILRPWLWWLTLASNNRTGKAGKGDRFIYWHTRRSKINLSPFV